MAFCRKQRGLGPLRGQPLAKKKKTRIYVSAAFFHRSHPLNLTKGCTVSIGVGWGQCTYIIIHTITERRAQQGKKLFIHTKQPVFHTFHSFWIAFFWIAFSKQDKITWMSKYTRPEKWMWVLIIQKMWSQIFILELTLSIDCVQLLLFILPTHIEFPSPRWDRL